MSTKTHNTWFILSKKYCPHHNTNYTKESPWKCRYKTYVSPLLKMLKRKCEVTILNSILTQFLSQSISV